MTKLQAPLPLHHPHTMAPNNGTFTSLAIPKSSQLIPSALGCPSLLAPLVLTSQ